MMIVGRDLLESLFCFDSFITGGNHHHVCVTEAGVVEKNGVFFIALDGYFAFEQGHLVH